MSSNTTIEVSSGMKYDFSNLIKSCLIESYKEYKTKQLEIRNFLIHQNKLEKQKAKRQEFNLFVIHDLKIKHKKECILDFEEEKFIPKGYFCYPIKGAYFQKSSFELPFFPYLPLKEFKEGIDTFEDQTNISESYLAYPCLLEKDYERVKNIIIKKYYNLNEENPLIKNIKTDNTNANYLPIRPIHYTSNINKYFIIWTYIKILRGQMLIMNEDFKKLYSEDKNKILIPIFAEISKYVKIDINILYHIITTFLNQCIKKLSKNALSKKGITYKKYEKYWCRICNRFYCPFHFKIKVKCKTLNNGNIRTTYEYFKKIQITLRPPEYYIKEEETNKKNKNALEQSIQEIISNCDYCNYKNLFLDMNDNFKFDESLRFNKMAKITNKEDFFVLCKIVKTCTKFLSENSGVVYNSISNNYDITIKQFLSPCVLRRILNDKYDCNLLRYLLKLITDNKYLNDINLFLKALSGVSYESISEDNFLYFNNSIETNLPQQKITAKGEKKIIKMPRKKTTARLQTSSDINLYFKPCDHYPYECTPENCACAKLGICLKYCCCFKENDIGSKKSNGCQYMFLACQHPSAKSKSGMCSGCNCYIRKMECVPGVCCCGELCTNNNITLGKTKKLIYGFSHRIKGGGLFAGENIKEGEFIDVYEGEMVEKEELDRLSVFYDQTGNNYPFNINDKFDYVSIKCGGLTRYINHASFDEENVRANKIMVNGVPYIAFYAKKNIKQYEELFYDYSYDENSMPKWMQEYNRQMEMRSNSKNNKKQNNKKKGNLNKNKDKKGETSQKLNKSINLDEDLD